MLRDPSTVSEGLDKSLMPLQPHTVRSGLAVSKAIRTANRTSVARDTKEFWHLAFKNM